MSKRTRTLVLSAVALLVLGAVLAALLLMPPADTTGDGKGGTTTTTAPSTEVELFKADEKVTVSSVTVTSPEETFTVAPDKNGDMVVKGYEDLPQYPSGYKELTDALLSVSAFRLISDTPEHPEDFGFDKDTACTAKVSATYSDGSTFAFELGDQSPSGDGYYLRKDGSAAIYLVDVSFGLTVSEESTFYLSTAPMTAPQAEDETEQLVVRDATLFGSVRPEPIVFQIDKSVLEDEEKAQYLTGYYVTKPYFRNIDTNTTLLNASAYYGITAVDIEKVRPTAADLKNYGLDQPYSAATVFISLKKTTENKDIETGKTSTSVSFKNTFEYTIKIGNETEDGMRYAVIYAGDELIPLLYIVDPANVEWMTTQYDELVDKLMFFLYIDQVEEMTMMLDGKTTAFKLKHNKGEEDRDKQLTVISNGKQYSTPDFRTLYQNLMGVLRSGSADTVPSGQPVMTIDLKTNLSLAKTSWIKIYRESAGKYVVSHDTGELYQVDAKDLEIFMNSYRKFLAGESLD